jgi:hypothetical protein
MRQPPMIKRWYSFVAEHPCLGCIGWPVEMAHLELLISPKTGLQLPRRIGINEWAVIPLCEKCHRTGSESIHALGEDRWMEKNGLTRERVAVQWGSWLVEWIAGGMKGE